MERGSILTLAGTLCLATVAMASSGHGTFCYPGDDCWPSYHDEVLFSTSLGCEVLVPSSPDYANATIMINTLMTRYPYAIVLAETVDDIIKSVNFANRFNIKISIRSSGHDYIGRSTGDGTLQINLYKMKGIQFNLTSARNAAGEVTVESGNSWLRVYNETNKVGRVIVGGSAHTVAMGGYTLGGGHSPIGRKFGMAVDNLLEIAMVTADGRFVHADNHSTRYIDPATGAVISETPDTDLFWAVRGGGGGTFGIVTSFTFKVHHDSPMVVADCVYGYYDAQGHEIGRHFVKLFNDLLATNLAPEWGGYEIFGQSPPDPTYHTSGYIFLHINHFGPWGSDSFNTIGPFIAQMYPYCSFKNVSSFLEYEKDAKDALYTQSYIFNSLIQPDSFTDAYYDFIAQQIRDDFSGIASFGCTGTLIGGHMKDVGDDETAVNPNFRSAVMSLSCGISPKGYQLDPQPWVSIGEQLGEQLIKFGKGTYFNEPAAFLSSWKMDYWGGHYDRLLKVKRDWDPHNVFTCLHCVGSDLRHTPVDPVSTTASPTMGPAVVG